MNSSAQLLRPTANSWRRGFTLIELLTVVAIIGLLISILVPALSKARDQARRVSTRASLDAMSKGLELFRNELPEECPSGGYPPSATRAAPGESPFDRASDDPTEDGYQRLSGAQLLVRYLLGKDLKGYVPKRNVPRSLVDANASNPQWLQKGWYDDTPGPANMNLAPFKRSGPYVEPTGLRLSKPRDLEGAPAAGTPPQGDENDKSLDQIVAVDHFDTPILYYAANPRLAADPATPIACLDDASPRPGGIYRFSDNVVFTGLCQGNFCRRPPWNLSGISDSNGTPEHLGIQDFGLHPQDIPTPATLALDENRFTFPYYIMNKAVWEGSSHRTASPYRKTSFLMISAGPDKLYGTNDDITNFD